MNIESYNAEELFYIFEKFVKDGNWKIKDNKYVMDLIESNYKYFKFYAGDMLKIFQKAKEFYSLRIMKEMIELKADKLILSNEDISNSIKSFVEPLEVKEDDRYMFSMYT